jgi:hypothetical protein
MTDSASISQSLNCPYCGLYHPQTICALIKSIEYDGPTIKRIEFHEREPRKMPQEQGTQSHE